MSRMHSTARDHRLESYLSEQGLKFDVVDASRHARFENEWNAIYGDVWRLKLRHKRQAKAEEAYAKQRAIEFLIVPFLGDHAGPHGVGTPSPRTTALACVGDGALPRLAAFSNLDFFVAPPDLSWTMIHTHEDYVLGGPYYIERAWLTASIRNQFTR